jgi:hypothetical protein
VKSLPPKHDARRHARVQLPARCWIGDGRRTVYMRIHDLSRGGLSVHAPVPFAPEDPVELRLELPGGRSARARGQIVWVKKAGESRDLGGSGARMGAQFLEWLSGRDDLYEMLPPGS